MSTYFSWLFHVGLIGAAINYPITGSHAPCATITSRLLADGRTIELIMFSPPYLPLYLSTSLYPSLPPFHLPSPFFVHFCSFFFFAWCACCPTAKGHYGPSVRACLERSARLVNHSEGGGVRADVSPGEMISLYHPLTDNWFVWSVGPLIDWLISKLVDWSHCQIIYGHSLINYL